MRIITGIYKGRHFDIPRSFKARPTTDFAKENIFNVLIGYMDFEGAKALDLFSGTGSITLELLSRGCAEVVSVELDRDHHRFIKACVEKLSQGGGRDLKTPTKNIGITNTDEREDAPSTPERSGHVLPLRADVFRFVKSCKQQFDFIFADPPYALPELPTLPHTILNANILRPEGIFVLEHGKDNDFSSLPHFLEHRVYGSVNFSIFRSEK